MFSPEEIIELSDSEGDFDPPPHPPSSRSLPKKASDLLADKKSTGKVDLNAVNSLINKAMDLQNNGQENDVPKPGDHSQVECLNVVGNVTSTTDTIVEIEDPDPTESTIDVLEIKPENITEEDPCSSAQLLAPVTLDGPPQISTDFLPDISTSCAIYLIDCSVVTSQSTVTPDIVMCSDDPTEIMDKDFPIDLYLPCDLSQSALEEEPGPSSSGAILESGKGTALSRELTRIQSTLCSKTWTVSTQKARLKKGEFGYIFPLKHN